VKHRQRIAGIRDLMDRYLEIVQSDSNRENARLWTDAHNWNRDKLRGIRPSKLDGRLPFVIEPDISLWRKLFDDAGLIEYYNDPYTHMEFQLRRSLKHHEMYKDNFVFTDELYIWFGVITELSLFGSEVVWQEHKEGWVKEPVLASCDEAQELPFPDFYTSGVMPKVHEFYEVMNEVSDGRMKVMFPELARGPFCMAVHKLMRVIVDAEKSWTEERTKFTGEPPGKCKFFNDEIDCPSIGPAVYDDIILPYEKELAEGYGGVRYWHSCGNISAFLPAIRRLPSLDVIHIGPWTSYEEADGIFGDDTALEICLHPVNDIFLADETQMRARLEDIIEKCPHKNFSVRADALMPQGSDLNAQLEQIKLWEHVAREYFG
jgi:hypothetical protein